ncbi:hypothetical protein G3M48_000365 [Beauveria asiatica]|uniref:Trichothecene 3-O-acetyltransferase n=1 Tax=Beauveria asiatica TaxID=1069075 RepID=A0AAW0S0W0_9HYPO
MHQEPTTQSRPLTTWNQAAVRGYIRQVYCFSTDGGRQALDALRENLDQALKSVCLRMAYMAGRLSLSKEQPGILVLHTGKGDQITVATCDARGNKNLAFSRLKKLGFPAGAFVGPLFDNGETLTEDGLPIPVAQVLLILVDGGILMCPFVYHSITDGVGLTQFLSAVAAAMKGLDKFPLKPQSYPNKIDISMPSGSKDKGKDAELANVLSKQCPDLKLVKPGANHEDDNTSIFVVSKVKFGGIFVFGPDKLQLIKDAVLSAGCSRRVSTFCCLTAICWAFMTTARLRTVGAADGARRNDTRCRVFMPTWWGDRLFPKQLVHYAGNAVVFTEARHGTADLFTIAETAATNLTKARGALARVVQTLEAALGSVDEGFVKTRSALFNSVRDPRQIQYSFTPSDPTQLFFNSWRRLGADIEWTIPTAAGLKRTTAEAVRKSQSEWNESAGLIMPGRRDQEEYEVVLSSDTDSMKALRNNQAWKSWVDREVF